MRRSWGRFVLKFIIIILILGIFGRMAYVLTGQDKRHYPENTVVALDMEGLISDADTYINILKRFSEDERIKGIILKVNSPGGVITPTKEIYDYIATINKPVYSAMDTMAASGGYYISIAADKVFAMPSTITGSIGVIMHLSNTQELMDKIGIKNVIIKSGEFKDIASPTREMTREEREILQQTVMDMYELFIADILKRRNMEEDHLRKYADGRIFTGKRAKDLGFVDNLGSWRDAFEEMKKEIGIDTLELRRYTPKEDVWERMMGVYKGFFSRSDVPDFYYLYDPGM
ncbi:signal peptide peptidase SppA [Limisalsivibrio acetivorans]|uniref:signal peptide peptidase SppA n=1 Tax=Limisalsivibrio acetivorans TaxID=1304888 RepID=UPI0003B3724D|nr:signal peptide peptidase SppA [Limisalsivibrio acetivorans]